MSSGGGGGRGSRLSTVKVIPGFLPLVLDVIDGVAIACRSGPHQLRLSLCQPPVRLSAGHQAFETCTTPRWLTQQVVKNVKSSKRA